jgi:hypothetical protein
MEPWILKGCLQLNDSGRATSLVVWTAVSAISRAASRRHPQSRDARVQFDTNAPRPVGPAQIGNRRNSRLGGLRYLIETVVATNFTVNLVNLTSRLSGLAGETAEASGTAFFGFFGLGQRSKLS